MTTRIRALEEKNYKACNMHELAEINFSRVIDIFCPKHKQIFFQITPSKQKGNKKGRVKRKLGLRFTTSKLIIKIEWAV